MPTLYLAILILATLAHPRQIQDGSQIALELQPTENGESRSDEISRNATPTEQNSGVWIWTEEEPTSICAFIKRAAWRMLGRKRSDTFPFRGFPDPPPQMPSGGAPFGIVRQMIDEIENSGTPVYVPEDLGLQLIIDP